MDKDKDKDEDKDEAWVTGSMGMKEKVGVVLDHNTTPNREYSHLSHTETFLRQN